MRVNTIALIKYLESVRDKNIDNITEEENLAIAVVLAHLEELIEEEDYKENE